MDEQQLEMFIELVDDKLDELMRHNTIYYKKENGEKYLMEGNDVYSVVGWYENCFKADLRSIFTEKLGIVLNI